MKAYILKNLQLVISTSFFFFFLTNINRAHYSDACIKILKFFIHVKSHTDTDRHTQCNVLIILCIYNMIFMALYQIC